MTATDTTSAAAAATRTPRPAAVRRRSRSAVARSAAGDRSVLVLLGLVLLVAGVAVALLSYGVFGAARAARPLLDPVVVDVVASQLLIARIAGIALGIVLLVLGLIWASRSLRPERRPDLVVDGGPDTSIVVSSAAVADAVAGHAGGLAGVGRARARMVGDAAAPAMRVTLWLADDADIATVLTRLDDTVLEQARRSLGLAALPVAVRLELDATSARPRVA